MSSTHFHVPPSQSSVTESVVTGATLSPLSIRPSRRSSTTPVQLSTLPPVVHDAALTFSQLQFRYFEHLSRREKRKLITKLQDPRVDNNTLFTDMGLVAEEVALHLFATEPVRRRADPKKQ